VNDSTLFRIVYDSVCVLPGGHASERHLQDILEVARRCNLESRITGALRCDRVYFLQVLEGPRAPVVATMARIQRDGRHTKVNIIEAAPLARRDFADWSMALVPDRTATMARLTNPDLLDFRPATGAQAANALRGMLASHRA
jgi:hypothetical protein